VSEDLDTATTTEPDRARARPRAAALINTAATLATAIAFVAGGPPKVPFDCGD
jgi:hypothetical protein